MRRVISEPVATRRSEQAKMSSFKILDENSRVKNLGVQIFPRTYLKNCIKIVFCFWEIVESVQVFLFLAFPVRSRT